MAINMKIFGHWIVIHYPNETAWYLTEKPKEVLLNYWVFMEIYVLKLNLFYCQ